MSLTIGSVLRGVPVDPDADQARELLVRELSDPRYQQAQPTWFDRLSAAVLDWLNDLLSGATGTPSSVVLLIIVLAVAGLVIAAFFVFGAPRLNRRRAGAGALFGDDDARDSGAIRAAAQTAARNGDYALAIEEMFRAIARGLGERSVLTSTPGTTATGFATRAAGYFPGLEARLAASARSFDDVRYLDRPGTELAYSSVAALEGDVRAARPRFETSTAVPA